MNLKLASTILLSSAFAVSSATAQGPSSIVFVTSQTFDGNLGGLTGADAKCQTLAEAAGLGGLYKAWLSDSTGSPITRFVQSQGSYALVDDTIVANDWADLTDGTLAAPITVDENGSPIDYLNWRWTWSNTNVGGTTASPHWSCNNWSSSSSSSWRGGYFPLDCCQPIICSVSFW